jgi:hypothetical protein
MKISRRFWLMLTFSYMLAILWSSTIPSSSDTEGFSKRGLVMNLLHIPAYSILTYFFLRTFYAFRILGNHTISSHHAGDKTDVEKFFSLTDPIRIIQILAFAVAVCFGILNEFVQAHIPGREFSIGDMLRNALGAGLTLFFYRNKQDKRMSF